MIRKLLTTVTVVSALAMTAAAQAPAAAPATPAAAPAAPAAIPATPAPAGALVAAKIGIVNIQTAIIATNEGQRDFAALEKKFEPRRLELQNANAEIDTLKKQLDTQGPKLNGAARDELVKNIENKQKTLQRNLEDAQSDWANQQNDIANRIGGKMIEILEKYSIDNGYAVVLDISQQGSPVLWANANTNITKALVDAYNLQSDVPPPATPTPTPKPVSPTSAPVKK